MKTEGKWNWNEHVLMFRKDRMWKKCTPSQTTWNTFEVIIWTWWKMVIDRRNHCCFFPVDIAGYEKWHLVVAIFCSQKNKPHLFCIECNANFVWVFLYELCDCIELIILNCHIKQKKIHLEPVMGLHRSWSNQKGRNFREKHDDSSFLFRPENIGYCCILYFAL